jgi:hypothetical protein
MSLYNLTHTINQAVEAYIDAHMEETTAEALGIDPRACYQIWKNDDCVAIKRDTRGRFDYYAGAEYVNKDSVQEFGDWVFYSSEDERVAGWLECLEEGDSDEEDIDNPNWVGSRHQY